MKLSHTLRLSRLVGLTCVLLLLLRSRTDQNGFLVAAGFAAFLNVALIGYAWLTEASSSEKSKTLSPRVVIMAISIIGLWLAFVAYRAVAS